MTVEFATRYVLLQLGLGAVAITLGSFPIFVPNASQLQLAGVPSFWSSLSLVMGSRNWFWISLGGIAVILHALTCPATKSFLSTRLVLYIGHVSFAIYLLHYIVLVLFDHWIFGGSSVSSNRPEVVGSMLLLIIPLTLLIAYPFYIYIDAPSVKLARIFCDFVLRKTQPALKPEDRRLFVGMAVVWVVIVIVGAIPPGGGYNRGFSCPAKRDAPY